jgi:hypothetical protein
MLLIYDSSVYNVRQGVYSVLDFVRIQGIEFFGRRIALKKMKEQGASHTRRTLSLSSSPCKDLPIFNQAIRGEAPFYG